MSDHVNEEVRHTGGGHLVHVEMAPYAVAVRCENTGALCTGTLIALDIVLTLARCFFQDSKLSESHSTVELLAGVDTLDNTYVEGRTQSQRGKLLTIHPNFRPTSNDASFGYNDIALIVTENAFNQTPTVQAIKLGYYDWDKTESVKCLVTSYGAVNPFTASIEDDHLKTSEVVVERLCPCHNTLKSAFGTRTQRWLCVRPGKSGPTPCVGAGGAGLVCGGKLTGLLVGLVTFQDLPSCRYSHKTNKVSCDNSKTVPVFLDLCPFMPWLRFLHNTLLVGPTNCSKASILFSSLHHLLVVIITLLKGKLQFLR